MRSTETRNEKLDLRLTPSAKRVLQTAALAANRVTVGTIIADRPPYRSVRAELPHTAPTSDE
jgi:hypothetical protein